MLLKAVKIPEHSVFYPAYIFIILQFPRKVFSVLLLKETFIFNQQTDEKRAFFLFHGYDEIPFSVCYYSFKTN